MLIALGACGRLDFNATDAGTGDSSDGPVDAMAPDTPPCTAFGAWGTPVAVPGVSAVFDPTLSADRLEILVVGIAGSDGVVSRATRSAPTDAFGAPTAIADIASPFYDVDPTITADGRDVFFTSDRAAPTVSSEIYTAHRNDPSTPNFSVPIVAPGLEGITGDSVSVTPDGLALYATFGSGFSAARRASRSDSFGPLIPQVGAGGSFPSISANELELYVNSATTVDRYSRATKDDAWQLDATFAIAPYVLRDPQLSADGLRLVFWDANDSALYEAARPCL